MLKKFYQILKWFGYLVTGVLALMAILVYRYDLSFFPFQYQFRLYQLYLFATLMLLPFFRLQHPTWFVSKSDNFESPKKRALDLHHQDMAQHHTDRQWSSNGVSTNPWEYTTADTMTYDESINWAISIVKALFMSILFILAAPVFYLIAILIKQHTNHK
ncbi:hypothetical protein [Agrilactobacillus fermenti]|uniref:hypothetical protein n=1 Tax=Agrilactobacillus fermenti TaxID=2586909 RepID=UPI001E405B53|nr:hypothetical protein [Agrilactobacillus fermenti]